MKTLIRNILFVTGLATVSLPAFAADNTTAAPAPTREGRPHARALAQRRAKLRHRAIARLDLTDAQKQQLKAQRMETRAQLQALRSDTTLSKEQKRAKVRELVAGERTHFRSVLTADQQAQLDQMRTRLRHRRG
jgi:Spy/CpxP family protein refolding chaperone